MMLTIALPDGSNREFNSPVTAADIAKSIGSGLYKAAIAAKVDGKLVDLHSEVAQDAAVEIVTAKDPEGLEVIRHSCAHLMAQAVKELFPSAEVTIGPVIENGFYYDFAFERTFTPEDLTAITKKMQAIVKQNLTVTRELFSRDEMVAKFKTIGENYKVEIIEAIPSNENLSLYTQGDFFDLCRGPHVPSTGKIKAFALTHVAGAYWRGDSNNAMLQRIYGTAWATKDDLQSYLDRIAEAEKRDHRKLAKKLDLFHMQEEAPGMVFWHPKGWTIFRIMEQYIRDKLKNYGYLEIKTPQLVDRSLWEKSGHWDKFQDNMFTLTADDYHHAIKPMNCPCHIQVYNQGLKSYRDLPLRLAEFGSCHRKEPSGALHGLMRVRNFTQDDAHIFCTPEQIQTEVQAFIRLLFEVYKDFGFNDIMVKLSTRPDKRVGSDAIWDKAEAALEQALNTAELDFEPCPGEGAFYGPKIDFFLKDCLERIWQCGTVQLDFSMPDRLSAQYVAEDGSRQTPVMIHRAIIGTIERFMGILIEETAGNFPVWLAPHQVVVLNITDDHAAWATEIATKLNAAGFRAITDLRNEKVGYKVREHTLQKIPYMLVIGAKEVSNKTVSVRMQDGSMQNDLSLEQFTSMLQKASANLGRKD